MIYIKSNKKTDIKYTTKNGFMGKDKAPADDLSWRTNTVEIEATLPYKPLHYQGMPAIPW